MTILWPPFVGWMVFCSLLFRILSRTRVPKVLQRSIMALSWTRVGGIYISRMANLWKNSVIAPLDINFPARQPTGKPARLPVIGRKRSCPPPESAKLRDFFCTPQRAGIQRVTPVSREIPENFSKISSPKIWWVCQKSVPLHSQNRNEAYNTLQIWSNSIFENIT